MTIKSYKTKVIVSGDIVEIYNYENPINEGFTNKKSTGRSSAASKENKEVNRSKVMSRAKRDLRRIINSNIHQYNVPSKFVTLTFADNVKDLKKANYEFKKFRQRLEYELGFKLKYVCVPEFQKRGAVHYHLLMFNVPYIESKLLKDIWGNGFIKINKIESVDNVGAYVCKYMGKDNDDERLMGEKCYFSSRGLYKPLELKKEKEIEKLVLSLPQETLKYTSSFTNDYTGEIKYSQYNLSNLHQAHSRPDVSNGILKIISNMNFDNRYNLLKVSDILV